MDHTSGDFEKENHIFCFLGDFQSSGRKKPKYKGRTDTAPLTLSDLFTLDVGMD